MKIELTPTITKQKTNIFTRIKHFFVGKLKTLNKDVFEKCATTEPEKKVIVSRKYPNWCDGPDTEYRNNTIAKRRCYYPEDLEKMKTMTEDEASNYRHKLYLEKRFYYEESAGSLKELEEFLHSCGKTLDDVIIKDKE